MTTSIPDIDLGKLDRHRAEAKLYLPKTDEQYITEIEIGTDPYTSRWFGWAIVACGFATVGFIIYDLACGGIAQC